MLGAQQRRERHEEREERVVSQVRWGKRHSPPVLAALHSIALESGQKTGANE